MPRNNCMEDFWQLKYLVKMLSRGLVFTYLTSSVVSSASETSPRVFVIGKGFTTKELKDKETFAICSMTGVIKSLKRFIH